MIGISTLAICELSYEYCIPIWLLYLSFENHNDRAGYEVNIHKFPMNLFYWWNFAKKRIPKIKKIENEMILKGFNGLKLEKRES
jgi:hypothetical protein